MPETSVISAEQRLSKLIGIKCDKMERKESFRVNKKFGELFK